MKNIKRITLLIAIISLLSGCKNNKQTEITECSLINNNIEVNYNLKADYKIYSENSIVNKIEIDETVTSSSMAILEYFENYFTTMYNSNNKKYGGYQNKITKENDTLTSTTVINYSSINREKYAEDNSAIQNFFNSKNELTLEGAKTIYESLGATCK